jgi:hypothetical protein
VSAAGELLPAGCSRDLDLAEVPAWGEEVFILDPGGKVLNVPQETPPCCLSEDSPCCAPAAAPGRPEARRRPADCMVCGAPVEYRKEESPLACTFCGQVLPANARCGQGHFVCDNCHLRDAYAVLEHCCRTSTETDMIALLQQIRQHPAIPRHGPEHHPLVAGVILTAYRNLGGEVTPEMLASGLSRGRAIPGGACGFLGTCGAVTGAGIAFSLILGADPLKARERRQVQAVTQALLQEVAAYEAARCCQRESWLVLQKAAQLSVELLPIPLAAAAPLACRQAAGNPDCLGPACPLWAGVEGSSR